MRHSMSHIRTERLWLREIDESDAETVVRLRSRPEVYRFFTVPRPLTREEHLAWYRSSYHMDEDRLDWLAIGDEDGRVVGLYGAKRNSEEIVEVSYLTAPEARRSGYAGEAVGAVLQWAQREWGSRRGAARIHRDNEGSRRFAEKLGFRPCREDGGFLIYEKQL